MRYGTIAAVAAAACLTSAGLASAQTMEEAAHCRSLTNIVIPDLEESLIQLKPPSVSQQALDEIAARLEVMRALQAESQAWLESNRLELSEEEVGYYLMGGNVILGARNPDAIRGWIDECRTLFGI